MHLLESCLSSYARHPLALHLHVHATEAGFPGPSSEPLAVEWGAARGESSAEELAGEAGAVPGARLEARACRPGWGFTKGVEVEDVCGTGIVRPSISPVVGAAS